MQPIKNLFIALLLLLLPVNANAFPAGFIESITQSATTVGGLNYSYPSNLSSGSFSSFTAKAANIAVSSLITAGQAGNIQTLGVYIGSSGLTATTCRLSMYDTNTTGSSHFGDNISFTPVAGWNPVTISNYATFSGTVFRVAVDCNGGWQVGYFGTGTGYDSALSYATFPQNAVTWTASSGFLYGFRLSIQ